MSLLLLSISIGYAFAAALHDDAPRKILAAKSGSLRAIAVVVSVEEEEEAR
jgi:hypothetical protein